LTGLRALPVDGKAVAALGGLGADAKANPFTMQVDFATAGAGLERVQLSRHVDVLGANARNEILQQREIYTFRAMDGSNVVREIVPFAAIGVRIDGVFVPLLESGVWKEIGRTQTLTDASVTLEAVVVDGASAPVVKVTREFRLKADRYDIELIQSLANVSGRALRVQWMQHGPVDLPVGVIRYGGDSRRLRLGHLPGATVNPDQQWVNPDRFSLYHADVLGEPMDAMGGAWNEKNIWPVPGYEASGLNLSWVALTNRYFSVAVHPLPERQPELAPGKSDKRFVDVASVDRIVLGRGGSGTGELKKNAIAGVRLFGPEVTLAPGASEDLSMGIYAGPLSERYLRADARAKTLGMDGMVIYSFGGPCGFCTFQWLAQLLKSFLSVLQSSVVFDWGLAIVVLVVCVRTLLHPVTKWSQMSIQRFGKQMSALAPKQKKLQEKYGDDKVKLREEMAKLMKEENVNYAGMLGCLPMFLQTPIWIALSAMIYFTFELRHTPAFFGVFQSIVPGWSFLADLSEPDKIVAFGTAIYVPLISGLMGPVEGLNLLPVLMGVLFWFQQKYMTPPPTTELTPEMETQQKIMKVMIVFMFPLLMYNAPSALVIYFLANSGLGIIESQRIRKQVLKLEAIEDERKKLIKEGKLPAPVKKPGFFARLQAMAEAKQQQIEENRKAAEKAKRKGK
ncbi:MAG: membrane protein insertase YidC, partial [Phycisphaerales bacterium]|nr:membrane protein insertase YidC [Phycisphaerales bacterium]